MKIAQAVKGGNTMLSDDKKARDGEKWPRTRVLSEARKRTKELFTDNSKRIQAMLADLIAEAGWTEDEFIDALCSDVIQNAARYK